MSDWSDYTYDNIKAAYGHLFDIGPITTEAHQSLQGTPGKIEKEAQVDDVVVLWNYQICRYTMKRAARRIQNDLGVEERDIKMKHQGQDSKDPTSEARARSPD
jgi:hypothetical protein